MDINLLKQSITDAACLSYSRSGGHGGQNVNKVNTKVTLKLPLASVAGLNDAERKRVREILSNRINNEEEIVINADEERSQKLNQERAFIRLEALIVSAAKLPKHRKPTKPSLAAREKRLEAKRRHSIKKSERNGHLPLDTAH